MCRSFVCSMGYPGYPLDKKPLHLIEEFGSKETAAINIRVHSSITNFIKNSSNRNASAAPARFFV
jgi:hypothetical protein